MINNGRNFLRKIIGLWQSCDKKYKNLKSCGIGLIAIAVVIFMFSLIVPNENAIIDYIAKNICSYIGFIAILISINFFNFYMYIYNKNKNLRNKAKIFIIPILIFLGVTFLFAIPFIILIGIIIKIVSLRAKNMDNLITIMIFSSITLIIIVFFIYPNLFISYYFSNLIKYILESKYIFNLYVAPVNIFFFITLFMFESNLIFKLLMLYRKKELNKKKEKNEII
jgi:4-amino-4-deoxy-L-arabinose transferase-like glycosyltransferase